MPTASSTGSGSEESEMKLSWVTDKKEMKIRFGNGKEDKILLVKMDDIEDLDVRCLFKGNLVGDQYSEVARFYPLPTTTRIRNSSLCHEKSDQRSVGGKRIRFLVPFWLSYLRRAQRTKSRGPKSLHVNVESPNNRWVWMGAWATRRRSWRSTASLCLSDLSACSFGKSTIPKLNVGSGEPILRQTMFIKAVCDLYLLLCS